MKKNFIIGTSGHVDHGKTALIKALTGKDLDTHKEEKKRGITINNGFTHLKLGDADVGVIDVPGHKDFIKNMISGASGIDVAMVVIAANSGPEKQTYEHLNILRLLKVSSVIFVLTKCDLVEDDDLELTKELLKDLYKDTPFTGAPILQVSAFDGTGIEELKVELSNQLKLIQSQTSSGLFRLYIDRSFIIQGHGTVITGTVHSGSVKLKDSLWLYPAGKSINIRSIQRHGGAIETAFTGDRCSMNVTGIKKDEITAGMLISNSELNQTKMIDAQLEIFGDICQEELWLDALMYSGSFSKQVKVSFLDKPTNFEEEFDVENFDEADLIKTTRLIQIHLPESYAFCYGDNFILRNTSDTFTIGGGTVLDPNPLHHKRRRQTVTDRLNRIAEKGLSTLLNVKVHEAAFMKSSKLLAAELNLTVQQISEAVKDGLSRIAIIETKDDVFLIPRPRLKVLKKEMLKAVNDYHIVNYLKEEGISLDEIVPKFKSYRNSSTNAAFFRKILDNLVKEELLEVQNSTWCIKGRKMSVGTDLEEKAEVVKNWFLENTMKAFTEGHLVEEMPSPGIDEATLKKIIIYLQKSRWLTRVHDVYIHTSDIDRARETLLSHLVKDGAATVSSFRILLDANRKMCLNCFALFEKENLIMRKGDDRILTEKGKDAAKHLLNSINS